MASAVCWLVVATASVTYAQFFDFPIFSPFYTGVTNQRSNFPDVPTRRAEHSDSHSRRRTTQKPEPSHDVPYEDRRKSTQRPVATTARITQRKRTDIRFASFIDVPSAKDGSREFFSTQNKNRSSTTRTSTTSTISSPYFSSQSDSYNYSGRTTSRASTYSSVSPPDYENPKSFSSNKPDYDNDFTTKRPTFGVDVVNFAGTTKKSRNPIVPTNNRPVVNSNDVTRNPYDTTKRPQTSENDVNIQYTSKIPNNILSNDNTFDSDQQGFNSSPNDDRRSSYETDRPNDNRRPSYETDRPNDNRRPSYETDRPTDIRKPSYETDLQNDNRRPSYETDRPNDNRRPSYETDRPIDMRKPSYETDLQNDNRRPSYETDRPNDNRRPSYETDRPIDMRKPNYETDRPNDNRRPSYDTDRQNENRRPDYDSNRHTSQFHTERPGVLRPNVDESRDPITNKPPYVSGNRGQSGASDFVFRDDDQEPEQITGPDEELMSEEKKRRALQIAERMCQRYASENTEQLAAIPLIPAPAPVTVAVSKCAPINVPLVVGGQVVTIQQYPHMAALGWPFVRGIGGGGGGASYSWKCGGTLVSEQYVLTAAHCSYQDRDNTVVQGAPRVVQLGSARLSDPEASVVRVVAVVRHPKYKPPASYYDTALLKLATIVSFTESVRPACIGEPPQPGHNIIATGWGRTEFGGAMSQELRGVSLPVWETSECSRALGTSRKLPRGADPDAQICAGEMRGGKDTCQGDSGGPAVVGSSCLWRVVGVTSLGRACGAPRTPALYARAHAAFIAAVVWL